MIMDLRKILLVISIFVSINSIAGVSIKFASQRVENNLEVTLLLSSSDELSLGSSSFVFSEREQNLDFSRAVLQSNGALTSHINSGVYTSLSLHETGQSLHLLLLESVGNTNQGLVVNHTEVAIGTISIPFTDVCSNVELVWETSVGAQLTQEGDNISSSVVFENSGTEYHAILPQSAEIEVHETTLQSTEDGLWYFNNELVSDVEIGVFEATENGVYHVETSGECDNVRSSSIELNTIGISYENALSVYPNPVNSTTEVECYLMKESNVIIEVFDVLGNKIQSLDRGVLSRGIYSVPFSLLNIEDDGIYILKIQIEDDLLTERIIKTNN